MKFQLRINMDNDAFAWDGGEAELTREVGNVIGQIESGERSGSVRDINGNRVGYWMIKPEGTYRLPQ